MNSVPEESLTGESPMDDHHLNLQDQGGHIPEHHPGVDEELPDNYAPGSSHHQQSERNFVLDDPDPDDDEDVQFLSADKDYHDLEATDPSSDPRTEELVVREVAVDLIDRILAKVDHHINSVKHKIAKAEADLRRERNKQNASKRKVPVGLYLPPYFRNEHGRGPPLNEEAIKKRNASNFDALPKELKRWTDKEIEKLTLAVQEECQIARMQSYQDKLEVLLQKLKASGVETSVEEKGTWEQEIEMLRRKIDYIRHEENVWSDVKHVNWQRIASKAFKGSRTAIELRLRWEHEFSPMVNNSPWTEEEVERLRGLVKDKIGFVQWRYVASQLGTNRSSFAVFQKYKDDIMTRVPKDWTRQEDDRLLYVVELLRLGENIPWDKVCAYMPGRTRHQCKQRYMRALDKNVRHGRWTEEEDLLLLCAVESYGPKSWHKVSKQVPGRSDQQCKDRWQNVLCLQNSAKNGSTRDWTVQEDEKLLAGIEVFGKSRWRAIADAFLPHRRPSQIRCRFSSLVTTKLRFSAAQVDIVRRSQSAAMVRQLNSNTKKDWVFQRFGELFQSSAPRPRIEGLMKTDEQHSQEIRANVNIDPQEWERAQEKREEIEKRYANGDVEAEDGAGAAARILEMVNISEDDALALERRLLRRRRIYGPRARAFKLTSAFKYTSSILTNSTNPLHNVKKMRRPLSDKLMDVKYADDMDEEERVQHATEALTQVVRLYDQHLFHNSVATDEKLQAEMRQHFDVTVLDALCDQETHEIDDDTTLPPNAGTLFLNVRLQELRKKLCARAATLFPSLPQAQVPANVPEGYKRIKLPLSKEVTETPSFQTLKAHMRCLLVEPRQYEMAMLSEDQDAAIELMKRRLAELGTNKDVPVEIHSSAGKSVAGAEEDEDEPLANLIDRETAGADSTETERETGTETEMTAAIKTDETSENKKIKKSRVTKRKGRKSSVEVDESGDNEKETKNTEEGEAEAEPVAKRRRTRASMASSSSK